MGEQIISVDHYFDMKLRHKREMLEFWNALITDLTEKVSKEDHHESIYADYYRLQKERSSIMDIAGNRTIIVEQFEAYEKLALRRIEELTGERFR